MRSGFPSTPPSQPSPYRQLGSGGQQPVRVQMIIGLIVGLVLVAVPLYLWRRPDSSPSDAAAPVAEASGEPSASASPYVPMVDETEVPRVKVSPFRTLRCADRGPGKTPPERCDHVTYFEDALTRAIRENALCGPETKTGAEVSIVMEMHFRKKTLKISRGKSSSVPAAQTKELFACLQRAMPDQPDWSSIPHQHTHYLVNVKATYPPSATF
ncbi:MAG: hypothetical protein AAF715_23070 [Myxococcota bacterium]